MNKYNKYKPSGNKWLGDIPEHWEVKRIKDIFKNFGSGTTPSTARTDYYENGNICWLNTTDLQNDYIFDTKIKITQKALKETGLKIYPKNSLAIAMYGQGKTRGTVGLLQIPTTTNQAACIMYKPIKANVKYILYWFIHKYNAIRSINIGATQPNMNQDFIKFLILQFPTLTEQTAIAAYLDRKTAAIDKKNALLEKKIEYYKELRKSLINQTVTKGLNPNVKLKYSGIEWIGEILEHWEVKRFKDNLNLYTGNSISDKSIYEVKGKTFDYIATKNIEVETGEINYDNGIYIPKKNISFKISKANSVLLCLEGGSAGKKVAFNTKDICFVNKLCSIKAKRNNNKFIYYYIKSLLFENQFFAVLNGLIGGVSISLIKHFFIVFPPIEEQTTIANYLDEKTTKIDQIISNIQSQIAQLKELRKVLINDVVTGKIKVWEE